MDQINELTLELIRSALIDLRNGKFGELPETCYNSPVLNGIISEIGKLSQNIKELYNYALPLSKGNLEVERPNKMNFLAASLKELHSRLIHLTWQAQQIENGDYSQRVDFMGDFSRAFNLMIEKLDERETQLRQEIAVRVRTEGELLKKNTLITESIEYALVIQKTILPTSGVIAEYVSDHFTLWLPRDIVGGDFYWFYPLNDGFLLAVIDCTGHGVPGAFLTIAVNEMLNEILDTERSAGPSWILGQLNNRMDHCFYKGNPDQHFHVGLDAGLCKVDVVKQNIIFSGARCPLFVSNKGVISELGYSKRSIGYNSVFRSKKAKPFFDTELTYLPGDIIYMSTDGFFDQNGENDNNPFGVEKLKELLSSNVQLDMGEQRQVLLNTFKAYMGTVSQRDDVTIVGFKLK